MCRQLRLRIQYELAIQQFNKVRVVGGELLPQWQHASIGCRIDFARSALDERQRSAEATNRRESIIAERRKAQAQEAKEEEARRRCQQKMKAITKSAALYTASPTLYPSGASGYDAAAAYLDKRLREGSWARKQ
eukprot:SAG11_NODE_4051_length_2086_cov_1.212884_2_plen_134_part_00